MQAGEGNLNAVWARIAGRTRPLSPGYFPALTGYRALAAYLVYFHHFGFAGLSISSWVFGLVHEGHVGVTFFFVLSGFLIAWRYGFDEGLRSFEFRGYLLNRVARIWPLYLIVTVFTLAYQRNTDGWIWFTNLTFLRGFSDSIKFSGVAQGWSLTIEETFYLCAPVLFGGAAMLFRRYRTPVAVAAVLVQPLLWFGAGAALVQLVHTVFAAPPLLQNVKFVTMYTFFGRSFEFYCGYLAARAYRHRGTSPRSTYGLLTWSALALSVVLIHSFSYLRSPVYFYGIFHPLGIVVNNVLLPPVIAVLIYGLATERTVPATILALRPVEMLGRASYAFYLIHLGPLEVIVRATFPWLSFWPRFVVMNLIAIALLKLVEEPLNAAIKRRFAKPRTRLPRALAPDAQT